MNKNKILLCASLSILSLSLTSCGLINLSDFTRARTNNDTKDTSDTSSYDELTTTYEDLGNYYVDETPITDGINYKRLFYSMNSDVVPSVGDVNLLVIPVEFSDYTFSAAGYSSDEVLYNDLNRVFNGTSTDTGYFESVKSFYNKSSYGKLNLSFDIATKYSLNMTAKELYQKCFDSNGTLTSTTGSDYALECAVENYKSVNGEDSTKKYDSDSDGLIDAVMLIYSAPNSYDDIVFRDYSGDTDSDLYWAYCYWDTTNINNVVYKAGKNGNKTKEEYVASPVAGAYFWCSYDFIYSHSSCVVGGNVDSHTLVHEFGHLLGLKDYYSYDSDKTYSSVGSSDMMDGNIYDHDAYSKMTLGWVNPYIVTGNCTITLEPSTTTPNCIILAPDYNGTVFDEYILIEFFTPDGLNYTDSHSNYSSSNTICNKLPGVKIYHIDSRIAKYKDKMWSLSTDSTINYNKYSYDLAFSNSSSRTRILNSTPYDLIRVIHADKSLGLKNSSDYRLKDSHLFHKGDTFTLSCYSSFFANGSYMNSLKSLDYKVTINYCSSILDPTPQAVVNIETI